MPEQKRVAGLRREGGRGREEGRSFFSGQSASLLGAEGKKGQGGLSWIEYSDPQRRAGCNQSQTTQSGVFPNRQRERVCVSERERGL